MGGAEHAVYETTFELASPGTEGTRRLRVDAWRHIAGPRGGILGEALGVDLDAASEAAIQPDGLAEGDAGHVLWNLWTESWLMYGDLPESTPEELGAGEGPMPPELSMRRSWRRGSPIHHAAARLDLALTAANAKGHAWLVDALGLGAGWVAAHGPPERLTLTGDLDPRTLQPVRVEAVYLRDQCPVHERRVTAR